VIAIFDPEVDIYNGSRQFRFYTAPFPHGDTDLLQLNRSRDNVLVFLRGFELEYEATDHFVYKMRASIGVQPVGSPVQNSKQNCALGLTDVSAHQMGGLIHYTAFAFPKTYPFLKPDLQFSSSNPNGGPGQVVVASATVPGAIALAQVFYGLTSVDHSFDDTDHKLVL
jgi:hypothetical protein